MAKNKYKGLTVNQAISLADEEMKLFQEKWQEINDTEGFVSIMAQEKGFQVHEYLKGYVFAQGLMTLKNLAQAHHERKKPGFFSMLFRTKEAQEYRNERKRINELAKFFKDEENKDNKMLFVLKDGQTSFSPVYIDGLTQNDRYFNDIAKNMEGCAENTGTRLKNLLNSIDVNMQNSKDQIILCFMNEYDVQKQERTIAVDEGFTRKVGESIKEGEPENLIAEGKTENNLQKDKVL